LTIDLALPAPPEGADLRYDPWTVTRRWQQLIAEKVHGFGGVLLSLLPPLFTAVFGIPTALEQMPQRAIQTALAVRQLVTEPEARAAEEPRPEVRLAVHVGLLLVDVRASNGAAQLLPVGDTLALPVRRIFHQKSLPRMTAGLKALA
jgi:class 3 adenylate cyclase